MNKKLAKAILDTQRIAEESYDHDAAETASKKANAEDKAFGALGVDYSQFYGKTIDEAAKEACALHGLPETMSYVIYLLANYCWNDVADWSAAQLER